MANAVPINCHCQLSISWHPYVFMHGNLGNIFSRFFHICDVGGSAYRLSVNNTSPRFESFTLFPVSFLAVIYIPLTFMLLVFMVFPSIFLSSLQLSKWWIFQQRLLICGTSRAHIVPSFCALSSYVPFDSSDEHHMLCVSWFFSFSRRQLLVWIAIAVRLACMTFKRTQVLLKQQRNAASKSYFSQQHFMAHYKMCEMHMESMRCGLCVVCMQRFASPRSNLWNQFQNFST